MKQYIAQVCEIAVGEIINVKPYDENIYMNIKVSGIWSVEIQDSYMIVNFEGEEVK